MYVLHVFPSRVKDHLKKLGEDRHTIQHLGWQPKFTRFKSLELDRWRSDWPVFTIIYERTTSPLMPDGLYMTVDGVPDEMKTYGYSDKVEKKFYRDVAEFARRGLIINTMNLAPNRMMAYVTFAHFHRFRG